MFVVTLVRFAEGCSSRSTPKARPNVGVSTPRPNITFRTFNCPPMYDTWYCNNGATCFMVKIGESYMYNCEVSARHIGDDKFRVHLSVILDEFSELGRHLQLSVTEGELVVLVKLEMVLKPRNMFVMSNKRETTERGTFVIFMRLSVLEAQLVQVSRLLNLMPIRVIYEVEGVSGDCEGSPPVRLPRESVTSELVLVSAGSFLRCRGRSGPPSRANPVNGRCERGAGTLLTVQVGGYPVRVPSLSFGPDSLQKPAPSSHARAPEGCQHQPLLYLQCFPENSERTPVIGCSLYDKVRCADGYMGQRCEFKNLDGTYLPTRQRVMLETASIASGLMIAVILVIILMAVYVHYQRKAKHAASLCEVDGAGDLERRAPFSRRDPSRIPLRQIPPDTKYPVGLGDSLTASVYAGAAVQPASLQPP
ncbi:hypothetical protein AAG570_003870 [Ranatra chinensis]|uniref:EGF-like domain-containing protein n=1 Tax=Ranatra chinensis TaxID=642074 RepID=A0ABD0Y3I5_9HEMI